MVGRYQRMAWKRKDLSCRYVALRQLHEEVYEKYHFGNGRHISFVCPYPSCDETFEQSGEYTRHLRATRRPVNDPHHSSNFSNAAQLSDFCSPLPLELEQQLSAVELEVVRARENLQSALKHLRKEWGNSGSEKRRLYEEKLLAQVKDDPVYKYEGNPFHTICGHLQQGLMCQRAFGSLGAT
jgi:hypothetical protein